MTKGFTVPNPGVVKMGPVTVSTACPYCPHHPWKTLRGMKDHVRSKHLEHYHSWLLAAGLRGMTKQEKQARRLEELRNDPRFTAARYDEVIKLRMLLLEFLDYGLDSEMARFHNRILDLSKTWGKKGDCI